MTCEACALNLQAHLSRVPGVLRAEVSFEEKTASVTVDPNASPALERILSAIEISNMVEALLSTATAVSAHRYVTCMTQPRRENYDTVGTGSQRHLKGSLWQIQKAFACSLPTNDGGNGFVGHDSLLLGFLDPD